MNQTNELTTEKKTSSARVYLVTAVIVLYAVGLAVLAADELLGLGLFPPELDKRLRRDIKALADPNIPADEQREISKKIVNYHEFSVPHLLKALKSKDPVLRAQAAKCLQQIAEKFFKLREARAKEFGSDPERWKEWWKKVKPRG